ncbi:MAG TPA: hypothetical protein VLT45_05490 [Kofleriaceae bacterium]|nr:hypothetical protein [Kofleriaceae bacterium]
MNPVPTVLAVVFGGMTAYQYVLKPYFSRASQLTRELGRYPRMSLAELPEGTLGRVVGKAVALDDTLEAPLSGRPCLYYTSIVEVSDGKDWKEIIREDRAVMFVLDDGSERAIVDPSSSKVVLDFMETGSSGTFDKPTAREQAFLDAHDTASTHAGGLFNRSLRYREAMIEVGGTIAIYGATTREPDPNARPDGGYRGDAPTQLRMTSSRKQPMVISNSASATR